MPEQTAILPRVRILVIGGAGLTGTPLVRELTSLRHDVIVATRTPPASLPDGATHLQADAETDVDQLVAVEPDVVVDMVALRADHAHRVARFTGIARWAVVASSCDVYLAFGRLWRTEPGDLIPTPFAETAPLRTRLEPTGEAYTKIGLETRLRELALPVTVVRLPAVHGPGDHQHRLWPYLRRIRDNRPIVLPETLAGWRWARGYSDNVAHAHALALAATTPAAAGETYNIADTPTLSERDWVTAIAAGMNATADTRIVPDAHAPRWKQWDYRQHYELDTTKIERKLGYTQPVATETGIKTALAWQAEHPADNDWFGDYAEDDDALRKAGT